ncbi:DUF5643 domain-containing protein [Neobacillus massiliamazoniensis]|nr:DUF5643 domain-containing protein [Neobacillus massiliamazoniensis]
MKKVPFTPATTEINFEFTQQQGKDLISAMNFRLYDDKGIELQGMGLPAGGQSSNGKDISKVSVYFEPIKIFLNT